MNPKQRVEAQLRGEKPDYVPIVPKIAFANVIACPEMTVRDYMTSGANMAEACIAAYRMFGWDGVSLQTDIGNEGKAMGSVYRQPENTPSQLVKPLLESVEPEELEKVHMPDICRTEPFSIVLDAVKRVVAEIGGEAYVISWTNGPLNVASQLLGINELLPALIESPDEVLTLLEKCTDVACAYAQELVKAGAQAIAFGHATASTNLISPKDNRTFALPFEKRLVDAIHEAGAVAITHICGNILPIIEDICQNGSEVIDFDHVCELEKLMERAPDRIFRGNIDPALLALGTPEAIREQVEKLLHTEGAAGRLLLGSGCEINTNTPVANLHAFVQAGRQYGRIKG